MIILILLFLHFAKGNSTSTGTDNEFPAWNLFVDQFRSLLIAYDLLRGPGNTNSWLLYKNTNLDHFNSTGKIKNQKGLLVDVQLPPFIDQFETYPQPIILDSILVTYNSSWRAYIDWRRRRFGSAFMITNDTRYDDLYGVVESPLRVESASEAHKNEFRRLLEMENRFFRIATTTISGVATIHPRHVEELNPRLVEYLTAALDGGERLETTNRLMSWRSDRFQYWETNDVKSHNWYVVFSDAFGTHFPTSIKFGHVFDITVNRSSCQRQSDAKLSEIAQCYFAEGKLNLTVASSSKDGAPNGIEICPQLKYALRDLRAYFAQPSGHFEQLTINHGQSLSDFLRRIPDDARRFWQPTIVEARMTPICELVPLVKPNDLDAKMACEKNLLRYMRSIEPIDDRRSSLTRCARDERRLVTEEGAFCVSVKFSDVSCQNRAFLTRSILVKVWVCVALGMARLGV